MSANVTVNDLFSGIYLFGNISRFSYYFLHFLLGITFFLVVSSVMEIFLNHSATNNHSRYLMLFLLKHLWKSV